MKIHQYKEMMKYLTRPDVSNIPIPLPQVPSEPRELSNEEHAAILNERARTELAIGGRVGYKDAGSATLSINPMLDNLNPDTIGGGSIIPLAGAAAAITVPMIADRFNISMEDAAALLRRQYTGPDVLNSVTETPSGLVIGGERLTEEGKPKIETFPSGEKQDTSLVTKTSDQIKTDQGLKPDTGIDTSILYNRKANVEKQKEVETAFYDLKKELGREPSQEEVGKKIGMERHSVQYYLRDIPKIVGGGRFATYKEVGDSKVDKIINTSTGNKWPDQETKDDYESQILERLKYPMNGSEVKEKYKSGELLTNDQLAKKYGLSVRSVEQINTEIIKNSSLNKPVIGREETRKIMDERRKEAKEIFSDPNLEQKISGNFKAHLSHMGDLYNRIVTSENLGYAPSEVNDALSRTLDPILKDISKKQDNLVKNKPEGWKKELKQQNIKGMNYSALSKGYKTFDVIDPETLEKKTVNVDYGKVIDPTGIYEGKSIKEIAKETNLSELNKIKKAFNDYAKLEQIANEKGEKIDLSKIKNKELITQENFNKLKNYDLFNKNRQAVLENEAKKTQTEKQDVIESLLKSRKPNFSIGGRVNYKKGSEYPTYEETPTYSPDDILNRMITEETDPIKILALSHKLDMYKKKEAQIEKEKEAFKQSEKARGVRYKEDFPSTTDYLTETGKQFISPKGLAYTGLKGVKGAVEGTEWLGGQFGKSFLGLGETPDPSKGMLENVMYHPVAGEKLGIDKLLNYLEPDKPTTGMLTTGDVAELAGTFVSPGTVMGLGEKGITGIKSLGSSTLGKDIAPLMDQSKRNTLKIGAGIAAAPLLEDLMKFKGTKAVKEVEAGLKIAKVSGMPEWFPSLVSKIEKEGKFPTKDYATTDNVKIKELVIPFKTAKGKNESYIMTTYPNGRIEIHADIKGGAYGEPFELHYTPPESFVDEATGKVIKEPGDFSVVEQRPRPVGGPEDADFEFDWENLSKDQALSDIEKVEQTVTGKIADPKAAEKRASQRDSYYNTPYDDITDRYGDSEILYDRMKDEGLL